VRFIILTQYFPPEIGGAQTRLYSFASELKRLGHEVEVVTAFPNYPKGKFFEGHGGHFYKREIQDGIVIHRVWLYPAVGGGLKRMLNYGSFTLTCFYGLAHASKPDFIFVESPPLFLSFPAYIAGLFWGAPFIFNVADLWPDVILDGGFMKDGFVMRVLLAIERWSYRKAAYVNNVTDWIANVLKEKKKVPAEKLVFLPNGADTTRFQPRPADDALQNALGLAGKKIILWAGTLGYAHGLEHVLQTAKLLEPHAEIHFLFVGDGSARKDLERIAQEMKLENVTFRDPVSLDSIAAYHSISMCGLASLVDIPVYEGARPSKVFPVLASAKPLLFVGKGEGARIVRDANAGIVVPPADPQALAESILQLARDPELAERLGKNGRQYVEEHLQWTRLVSDWLGQIDRHKTRIAEVRGVA
jgi:colanic acid biosynthesis glycosyl transferase WcaI